MRTFSMSMCKDATKCFIFRYEIIGKISSMKCSCCVFVFYIETRVEKSSAARRSDPQKYIEIPL